MTIILSMILSMISIFFLLTFIFDINKKNKNFLIIRDKNKYIIFKNEKWKIKSQRLISIWFLLNFIFKINKNYKYFYKNIKNEENRWYIKK